MRGRHWVLIAFVSSTVICAVGIAVLAFVLDNQQRNRDAIRTGCVLLANAIVQSGAGGMQDPGSPRAKLNALYVEKIREHFTAREYAKEAGLQAQIARGGALIDIPDCERIVKHPEDVHAIPLQAR